MNILKKLKKKRNREKQSFKKVEGEVSEIEALTTKLLEETIGEKGLVREQLQNMLNHFDTNNNPLGVTEAEFILFSLIKVAIAQRRLLSGRIEKSVEEGELFERYYGRMQIINQLTIDAHTKMKKMQVARERYEYQLAIYQKVVGKTYERDLRPNDNELSNDSINEIWTDMDMEGGRINDTESEKESDMVS